MTFSLVGYLFWARDWCQYNIGMDAHQSSPGLHLSDQTFGNLFAIFYARHRTIKILRICFNISNCYLFTISNHFSSEFQRTIWMLDHTCMHYFWPEQCIRKIIRLGLQKSYYHINVYVSQQTHRPWRVLNLKSCVLQIFLQEPLKHL